MGRKAIARGVAAAVFAITGVVGSRVASGDAVLLNYDPTFDFSSIYFNQVAGQVSSSNPLGQSIVYQPTHSNIDPSTLAVSPLPQADASSLSGSSLDANASLSSTGDLAYALTPAGTFPNFTQFSVSMAGSARSTSLTGDINGDIYQAISGQETIILFQLLTPHSFTFTSTGSAGSSTPVTTEFTSSQIGAGLAGINAANPGGFLYFSDSYVTTNGALNPASTSTSGNFSESGTLDPGVYALQVVATANAEGGLLNDIAPPWDASASSGLAGVLKLTGLGLAAVPLPSAAWGGIVLCGVLGIGRIGKRIRD